MTERRTGTAGRSHEFVDHTSEIVLRVRAPSFAALVEEAGLAMSELMLRREHGELDPEPRELSIEGADEVALLAAWLNELVFLGEADSWAPVTIEVASASADEGRIVLRASGVRLDRPFVLVKAATLHGLEIRRRDGLVEAEVTLDV